MTCKFTADDVYNVRKWASQGLTKREIATRLNMIDNTRRLKFIEYPELQEAFLQGKSMLADATASVFMKALTHGKPKEQLVAAKWLEQTRLNIRPAEKPKSKMELPSGNTLMDKIFAMSLEQRIARLAEIEANEIAAIAALETAKENYGTDTIDSAREAEEQNP